MKNVLLSFLAVTALISSDAHAGWQRVLTCDGAVVDVNEGERRNLALWVKDMNVLRALNEKGLERLNFGQTELAVYGSTRWRIDFGNPTGPKAIPDWEHARGVFHPQDFSYFTADRFGRINSTWIGNVVTVYRDGDGINLQYQYLDPRGCAGQIVPNPNPEGGPGDGQWGYYCEGDDYTALVDQAKFHFGNCR